MASGQQSRGIKRAQVVEVLEHRVAERAGGLGLLMGFWILASIAADFWERVRPVGGLGFNGWIPPWVIVNDRVGSG